MSKANKDTFISSQISFKKALLLLFSLQLKTGPHMLHGKRPVGSIQFSSSSFLFIAALHPNFNSATRAQLYLSISGFTVRTEWVNSSIFNSFSFSLCIWESLRSYFLPISFHNGTHFPTHGWEQLFNFCFDCSFFYRASWMWAHLAMGCRAYLKVQLTKPERWYLVILMISKAPHLHNNTVTEARDICSSYLTLTSSTVPTFILDGTTFLNYYFK